ncbi:MAG: sugar transferase [Hyphomicrobium sp.]
MIGIATTSALLLRDNLEFHEDHFAAFIPYLIISLSVSAVVLPMFGIPRAIWRFTALRDYLMILGATVAIVLSSVAVCFAYSRMEEVARAIPVLQGILTLIALIGLRILMRVRHAIRGRPRELFVPLTPHATEMVLIVGINRLSDLFMRTAAEIAPATVRVAGLLGRGDRHTGLLVRQLPVLGTPEQIFDVLRKLEIHGVVIDRIVVAIPFNKLNSEAQRALLDVEKSLRIRVDFLVEMMGLDRRGSAASNVAEDAPHPGKDATLCLNADTLRAMAQRPYWRFKRSVDFVSALVLLIILSPIFLIASVVVALDVGLPITFWQQRPGLGGHPFPLFKFRTMLGAHDERGQLVPDDQRVSRIGRFLRKTRIDELPQLINILAGEMSFIGPRPLLPVDQPTGYESRLIVRPGLTGWAQVSGGRDIPPADKAALDIWYAHNASLALDIRILLRTVAMVIFGEQKHTGDIEQAWLELKRAGIARSANKEPRCIPTEAPKAAHSAA